MFLDCIRNLGLAVSPVNPGCGGQAWMECGAMAHTKLILCSKTQVQGQDIVSELQRSRTWANLLQEAYTDHLPLRTPLPVGPHGFLIRPSVYRWSEVPCPRLSARSLPASCASQPEDLDWSLGKQDHSGRALWGSYTMDKTSTTRSLPFTQTQVSYLPGQHLSTSSTQSVGPLLHEAFPDPPPKGHTTSSTGPPTPRSSPSHLYLCPRGLHCNVYSQGCLPTGLGAP